MCARLVHTSNQARAHTHTHTHAHVRTRTDTQSHICASQHVSCGAKTEHINSHCLLCNVLLSIPDSSDVFDKGSNLGERPIITGTSGHVLPSPEARRAAAERNHSVPKWPKFPHLSHALSFRSIRKQFDPNETWESFGDTSL